MIGDPISRAVAHWAQVVRETPSWHATAGDQHETDRAPFKEADYRHALTESDPGGAPAAGMHRRFQIELGGFGPAADRALTFAGTLQDEVYVVRVIVAYDLTARDRKQVGQVATSDARAIRQRLEHPDNRAPDCRLLTWSGTALEYRADRLLATSTMSATMRVAVEAA